MSPSSIAEALIREHHEIDAGIESFISRITAAGQEPTAAEVGESAAALLGSFAALRRHIYLEEEFIFPALDDPSVSMALMVMYREHGQIWRLMDQVEQNISANDAASNHAPSEILTTCQAMLTELERHNAKEGPIIYPHTDADLSESERQRLKNFLDTGQMPAGWVCREAAGSGP